MAFTGKSMQIVFEKLVVKNCARCHTIIAFLMSDTGGISNGIRNPSLEFWNENLCIKKPALSWFSLFDLNLITKF